jgi:hypothetical protein
LQSILLRTLLFSLPVAPGSVAPAPVKAGSATMILRQEDNRQTGGGTGFPQVFMKNMS